MNLSKFGYKQSSIRSSRQNLIFKTPSALFGKNNLLVAFLSLKAKHIVNKILDSFFVDNLLAFRLGWYFYFFFFFLQPLSAAIKRHRCLPRSLKCPLHLYYGNEIVKFWLPMELFGNFFLISAPRWDQK